MQLEQILRGAEGERKNSKEVLSVKGTEKSRSFQNLAWISGTVALRYDEETQHYVFVPGKGELLILTCEKGELTIQSLVSEQDRTVSPSEEHSMAFPVHSSGEHSMAFPVPLSGEHAMTFPVRLSAGHSLVVPSHLSGVSVSLAENGEALALSLAGSLAETLCKGHLDAQECFFPDSLDSCRAAADVLASTDSPERISSAAYRLLLDLHRDLTVYHEPSKRPAVAEAAAGIIREEFAYLEGVEELAERLEVSPEHLTRLFTAAYGISPGKFLRKRRLEYARELLLEPDMTVSLVSGLCGFSAPGYFAKAFRKEFGMSPGEYAAAHTVKTPGDLPVVKEDQRIYL